MLYCVCAGIKCGLNGKFVLKFSYFQVSFILQIWLYMQYK